MLLVAWAARPRGLMGRVMVRPSTGPSYKASCPRSYIPPKMNSHYVPRALQHHPPLFLQVEEAQFRMGPPHQGTLRARKNFSLRQVPNINWFGDGGQRFSQLGFRCPCPRCVLPGPPRNLVAAKGGEVPSAG